MRKIFINFISIIFILIVFDFLVFYQGLPSEIKNNALSLYKSFYSPVSEKELYDKYILGKNNFYRKAENEDSKKRPILLFGCSFVYGHKISEDKIMSHVLAKYTNRPVYNRAKHGFGVQNMLYQLQNENFYKIIPQPEYIIYTYIGDHVRRLYQPSIVSLKEYYDIRYSFKQGELKQNTEKDCILSAKIKMLFWNKGLFINDKKNDELLKQHFLLSKKYVDKYWPGSKFIIFIYLDGSNIENIIPDLIKAGFIIIKRNDIAPFNDYDPNYSLGNGDVHPNERAWDYIIPKLTERIK